MNWEHSEIIYGGLRLPLLSFDFVLHVGSMIRPAEKPYSLEGSGLSVSLCPRVWAGLCRASTNQTHRLARHNNRFLDYHAAVDNPCFLETVTCWGMDSGFITKANMYRFSYYDDELESEVYADYERFDEALAESGDDPDSIAVVETYVPTAGLLEHEKVKSVGNVIELVAILYSDTVLGLDGVWFDDVYDPCRYSAPRGVIHNSQLENWLVTPGDFDTNIYE